MDSGQCVLELLLSPIVLSLAVPVIFQYNDFIRYIME